MKNSLTKNLILAISFLSLGANALAQRFDLPSPTKNEFVYFTADSVTYDQKNEVAELKGNVEIFFEDGATTRKVHGEYMQIFTGRQILITKGPTTIEDEKGIFTANDIEFDMSNRKLIMKNMSADYAPIRVLSSDSIESENGRYILRKSNITCCNYEKPHYSVYVGKADLIPGDRIFATNAVLKIGKVPFLYLPFLYRSLNTDRVLTTYLDFDQSGNTGFGFLTSTVLSLGNFRAKANLDYYTKSGFGYGGEVAYDDPQKFRGSLQAYTIHDNVQDEQRWGIDGGYWWQAYDSSDSLNKSGAIYFSQLETRNVSDADFNDDFFRANPYVVSPDKLTRASVVRQSKISTFRVSYSNRRELNPDDKTYSNAEETLPKVDLNFNPFVIKGTGGLVNNVSLSFNNTHLEDYDFVQYFSGRWTTAKNLKLHRNFTLTPKVFYDQQIILKDPTNNDKDTFVGRYGGELNFRSDLITGMLDVGYRYT
ncbi:MAG: LPS export ABC transporter periplasmic protein LptC, partial [Elusimicrobiota bacterium]|nr:LPS export ABC transporter periplasmic protein LptC [Elusimicrobiota bacterium]